MSPLYGSLLLFDWRAIPFTSILSLLIGLLVFNDRFIAYLSSPIYLVPWALLFHGVDIWLVYAVLINLLYWSALLPELREYARFRSTEE